MKEREDARITGEDVWKLFRRDSFDETDESTQLKWIFVMSKLVPMCSVASKPFAKKTVQAVTSATEATTVSDEAFVYWILWTEEEKWFERCSK